MATLIALAAAVPAIAAPATWHSLAAHSTLHWIARFQDTPVKGTFPRFKVTADLNPAAPAGAHLDVSIETASVHTESADVTKAIRGAQWFAIAQYPKAVFSGVLQRADGHLEAQGTLRLKGRTQSVRFPITVTPTNGRVRLAGHFDLDRSHFDIGTGKWRSTSMIASRVTVRFSVLLAPSR